MPIGQGLTLIAQACIHVDQCDFRFDLFFSFNFVLVFIIFFRLCCSFSFPVIFRFTFVLVLRYFSFQF